MGDGSCGNSMRVAMWKAKEASNDRKDIVGVEVGVDQGVHACEILHDWKELKTLHLVDNYSAKNISNHGDARIKLQMFNDRVKWHLRPSLEAALSFDDNSLDFVYIDASHVFIDVLRDCIVWYKKVKVGGVLCGHDYRKDWVSLDKHSPTYINSYGVVNAVDKFIKCKNIEIEMDKKGNKLVLGTKTDGGSSDWWAIK